MPNAECTRVFENRDAFEGKFMSNYRLFSVIKITYFTLLRKSGI
jgi:hypothetical protein